MKVEETKNNQETAVDKPLRVLSLGAGVQSSTLALMSAHGEIDMPECAIFADTQSEPDSVYIWLDWLERQLPYPVHRVTCGNLSQEALRLRTSKSGNNYTKHSPPAWIKDRAGNVGIMMRQCTTDFKIMPIQKKLRELCGKHSVVEQYIGISMDEAHRMKPSRVAYVRNRWPLIEKQMTRTACLKWMSNNGYPRPPRSSCWFCPFHSTEEWLRLKSDEPETFAMAVGWEKEYQLTISQVDRMRGTPYLHRSCVPLGEIDFAEQSPQTDLFGNECEGVCGV